ncbi:carboxypeptidase Q-like [Arctopsyche grandis]|uniref:carboxypeptidase Q-like n=1 Tax=Arctopsyche grandis TaxID=121162 RepID=UPI00406D7B94
MVALKCAVLLFTILGVCNSASISIDSAKLECNLPQTVIDEIAGYANVTNTILDYFIRGPFKGETWKRISDFVDKFGSRISGSQNLEDSIDYVIAKAIEEELENIHTHNVEVPYWQRGDESVTLLEPRIKAMPMLGLGGSIGTKPEGITAQAVVVESFDELKSLSIDEISGKIVVYNQPFNSYGESSQYRLTGAIEAAKLGAVGSLISSVTNFSIATPHTGIVFYEDDIPKIPAAAITPEDADLLWRLNKRGQNIQINIKMDATSEQKISRNIIADLKGTDLRDSLVVVSGHIDSWDVGDGSMDDAGGSFISLLAPIVLKKLDLRPRRTIRTILFTGEEQGMIGAEAYELDNREENKNLSFVMESDFGTFAPLGLNYEGSSIGKCMLAEILKLFSSINSTEFGTGDAGPDISVWTSLGIPGAGLYNANGKYFWFHHTEGDTLNVLEPDVLDAAGGFWTAVAYIVANMENDIPRE